MNRKAHVISRRLMRALCAMLLLTSTERALPQGIIGPLCASRSDDTALSSTELAGFSIAQERAPVGFLDSASLMVGTAGVTAVPEPATWAVAATALAFFFGFAWRSK